MRLILRTRTVDNTGSDKLPFSAKKAEFGVDREPRKGRDYIKVSVNSLSPKRDQHQYSPNHITTHT